MSPLSQLLKLDDLWDELSVCLTRLREAADPHAVLVLQPAVEAFFLAHAAGRSQREAVSFISFLAFDSVSICFCCRNAVVD